MLIKRRQPVNLNPIHASIFEVVSGIELPEPSFEIHNWAVLLKNGILFTITGVKNQSLLYNVRLKEIGGYNLILKMLIKESLKMRFKFFKNDKVHVATAINEWSNNYFHWFTEVLPRIYFLKTQIPEFSILIPSNYIADFQLTSLKLLNVPFIYFEGMAILRKIYLPGRQAPYSAHYNPKFIKELATKIKSRIDLSFDQGPYIYITRRKAQIRKILNENEVLKILKDFSFCIIEFESLNFMQQVSIAHNAKVLMGMHGAGLTNMMFCNPETCIYEFSLEGEYMDKCYYTLADACDLKYYYQFCSSAKNNAVYQIADLFVDVNILKINLENLLKKNN